MSRGASPDDIHALKIPTDPRLSPDGRLVAFTVQTVTVRRDAYRHAIWIAPLDGAAPARLLTLGAKHDRHPRFSPDGRALAFLSDRRLVVEDEPGFPDDREDAVQVHLLPLEGGEARRATDCPRGVERFAWSPDGTRLVVVTGSRGATRDEEHRLRGVGRSVAPDAPRTSDYRYIERLQYMVDSSGFTYDRVGHLWLIDLASGEARRLTDGPAPDESPTWSPDGTKIAYATNRRREGDLLWQSDIHVVDVASGIQWEISGGLPAYFYAPEWLPDGRTVAALGHRFPAAAGSRSDIWLFAADGADAHRTGGRNLSAGHDLMPGSAMISDLTVGEPPRLAASADGEWITFTAPDHGSYELWRISTQDGSLERLTKGRHYISSFDQAGGADGMRIAYLQSTSTDLPDVWTIDGHGRRRGRERRLSRLNDEALEGIVRSSPIDRWTTVDGRRIQGWYLPPIRATTASAGPAADADRTVAPAPLVAEIHGGPHTLYGHAPMWEFQVLAGAGIGVCYCNPRGSEGYGEAFNAANYRDWGDGPMRDVLSGVDALVARGLADPDRLGVTGGSYGGYLTNWIVARDHRFRAALTCRSVSDLSMLMLTGDISGGQFGTLEFGAAPWEDPDLYRQMSPLSYAAEIRTPLLIQHSENDIRATVGQAEALFTLLRSHRRPVRLMRVPEETHELTRSGTPFRRSENLAQVRDWFVHFLVQGRRALPPLPRHRADR